MHDFQNLFFSVLIYSNKHVKTDSKLSRFWIIIKPLCEYLAVLIFCLFENFRKILNYLLQTDDSGKKFLIFGKKTNRIYEIQKFDEI